MVLHLGPNWQNLMRRCGCYLVTVLPPFLSPHPSPSPLLPLYLLFYPSPLVNNQFIGACGYSLSEFDTYVRHGVPVIAVVGK